MRRPLLFVVSAALLVSGLALALVPFGTTLDVPKPDGLNGDIRASCRRPIIAAWNRQRRGQVTLWAVTEGDADSWYEVRTGGAPYCAGPARRRLALAALALAASAVVGVIAIRRDRSPGRPESAT